MSDFCCFLPVQGVGSAEIERFWLSKGLEARFFPISDKKMRFIYSRRLFLLKNRDFSAPDDCF